MEENNRQFKGIWIPAEIWLNHDLSWNEKILLAEIDSFTARDKDFYMSNEYIANFLGVTETSANKILSSLIKKGFVIKTKFDGRKRWIKSVLSSEKVQEEHPEIKVEDMDNMPHENLMKLYLDCFLEPGYCIPNPLGEKISMMLRSDVDYGRVIRRILKMDYKDFLRTPYWSTVSEMVRERDNHKCRECGTTENLNVHHESYLNHGDEIHHLEDLVCLCHECHVKRHFI